jgi:hypothetical protein
MAVRHGFQDLFTNPFPEFHHPLLMTRRTKVPSFARKFEQKLVAAFATSDTCKTIMKDTAIKIALYNVFHIGTEKAILLCEPVIMNLLQCLEMIFNALIIFRKFRFAWSVDSRCVGHGLSL